MLLTFYAQVQHGAGEDDEDRKEDGDALGMVADTLEAKPSQTAGATLNPA